LLNKVKELGVRFGFRSVCYGHAGDGNLHINILKDNMPQDKWEFELPNAVTELFQYVKQLGGTLSGEHGVGWVQRQYMPIMFTGYELELLNGIKRVFDPNGILNPGKILP
jgi:glycolate oxidase